MRRAFPSPGALIDRLSSELLDRVLANHTRKKGGKTEKIPAVDYTDELGRSRRITFDSMGEARACAEEKARTTPSTRHGSRGREGALRENARGAL